VSDIDTAVVDSLKALDPKRPIREADTVFHDTGCDPLSCCSEETAVHNRPTNVQNPI
jgi:hypothetical protein